MGKRAAGVLATVRSMLQARTMLIASILDLALSYAALFVVVVLVHPVLNKRLLNLQ